MVSHNSPLTKLYRGTCQAGKCPLVFFAGMSIANRPNETKRNEIEKSESENEKRREAGAGPNRQTVRGEIGAIVIQIPDTRYRNELGISCACACGSGVCGGGRATTMAMENSKSEAQRRSCSSSSLSLILVHAFLPHDGALVGHLEVWRPQRETTPEFCKGGTVGFWHLESQEYMHTRRRVVML
jgi:hypothetical protein